MPQTALTGPAGWPVIGHLPAMALNPLAFLERLQRQYGDTVPFSYGSTRAVLVSHPDDIERVMLETGKHYHKGYQSNLGDRLVLGNGLVTSEGDFWRRQRKLAQPAFHMKRIAGYASTMVRFTLEALERWQGGQERDVHADMMALTQRIVAQTLFGSDLSTEAHRLTRALDVLLGEGQSDLESLLPDFVPTPGRSRLRWAVKELDTFLTGIIRARREQPGDHPDLLSMLLEARDENGDGMSQSQLLDEMRTMYLAGHETTSNAMTFAWQLLSQYPRTRAMLEQELHAVLNGRAPSLEDLCALPYADAVLKEAIRLYPPVWVVARVASRDVELGGRIVPKGRQVILSQWIVHRDARWFPEPLTFRPERWLEAAQQSMPKYAYFPFGGGPRICIGNSFAQMEATLILATIAQRFRLNPPTNAAIKLEPSATLRVKSGLRVRLERRGDQSETSQ